MVRVDARLTPSPWHKRFITWPLSGVATWLGIRLMEILTIDAASNLGGAIARTIGPRLPVSNRARRNLRDSFPEWDNSRVEATVREMWDNLGRVAGEFPHMRHLDLSGDNTRVEVIGREHIHALRDDDQAGIFFSGHLANWELLPRMAEPNGVKLHNIYRAMNAPLADKILRQSAGRHEDELIPKGPSGAMRLARIMRNRGHIAMLVDQKLNEGIDVPFFSRPAKTAPAIAVFALKYRCPVVPVRIERLGGARFRVTFWPPITLPNSGDREADTLTIMTEINTWLEGWIRDTPGQWLWLHRRWGK
ncbi:MAG: lauroyl acyltransferase [Alphaproteobacteria bacterium]|nr:lauroyl acyltransferase [Alphaproteobacteria bacterium]